MNAVITDILKAPVIQYHTSIKFEARVGHRFLYAKRSEQLKLRYCPFYPLVWDYKRTKQK